MKTTPPRGTARLLIALALSPVAFTFSSAAQSDPDTPGANDTVLYERVTVSAIPAQALRRTDKETLWQAVSTVSNTFTHQLEIITNSYTQIANGLNVAGPDGQYRPADSSFAVTGAGAEATGTAHHLELPVNINTIGGIKASFPDGTILESHPLCFGYYDPVDGSSLVLGNIRDAIGWLVASNQVVYSNCFSGGIKASISYYNNLAGMAQDLILEQRPPDPQTYGLSSASRLELWTEFTGATPEPDQTVRVIRRERDETKRTAMFEPDFTDTELVFGHIRFARGAAFAKAANADSRQLDPKRVPVGKFYDLQDGRRFLIEGVDYQRIRSLLTNLPPANVASRTNASVNLGRQFPTMRLARAGGNDSILIAQVPSSPSAPVFVLDYVTVYDLGSFQNYVFASGVTYLVQNVAWFYGLTRIEPLAVVKFAPNGTLDIRGDIDCRAEAYRPAFFTSKDDNSVGDGISGSSGYPVMTYDLPPFLELEYSQWINLKHLRFRYASQAIAADAYPAQLNIRNCQFSSCYYGLVAGNHLSVNLYNVLVYNFVWFATAYELNLHAEHLTAHQGSRVNYDCSGDGTTTFINSLLIGVTTQMPYVDVNSAWDPVGAGVFQTGAGGLHYLASGAHRDAGTSNIDPTLADELRKETTYAPQSLPRYLTADRLLTQYAPRDGDGQFDRGYHYDPIDYAALGTALYPAVTVTIAPGVVVGAGAGQLGSFGFGLLLDSKLQAQGSPLDRVRLTHLSNVHEAPYTVTYDNSALLHQVQPSTALLRFAVFGVRREGDELFTSGQGDYRLRDCRLQRGHIFGPSNYTLAATNCIFEHVYVGLASQSTLYCWLYNNTFDHGSVLLQDNGHNGTFEVHDNIFQETALNWIGVAHSYNGYIYAGSMPAWVNTQNGDVPLSTLAFQNGPLSPQFGDFYLPSSSGLESGSRTVAAAGLFHYTTRVDQQKDIQQVDLGFHYVALNGNQQPVDSDSDYAPDYFEDADGNGVQDGTEFSYLVPDWDHDADGLSSAYEATILGTSPLMPDTDGDGVWDSGEDPDGDKLSNLAEMKFGHLPFVADHAIVPRKLLVFYGYPGGINGSGDDVSAALSQFAAYDYVVLAGRAWPWETTADRTDHPEWAGLEEDYPDHPSWEHPQHELTRQLLAQALVSAPNTLFFGYIALGTEDDDDTEGHAELNYSDAEIQQHIDWWKAMKVDGIFFDEFGFDFMRDRSGNDRRMRQNAAVDMAHEIGFPVIANANQEEDALDLGYQFEALTTITPHLGTNNSYIDYYFYESHQINDNNGVLDEEDYVPVGGENGWKGKADHLFQYQTTASRANTNVLILSLTSTTTPDAYDQARFNYSWYSAFLFGHEATGWGDFNYSATSEAAAPLRPRPSTLGLGDKFIDHPAWTQSDTVVTRHTDTGTVNVINAPPTHGAGLTPN